DDVACSGCVDSTDIAAGAVDIFKIADKAVDTKHIVDNAVTSAKIATGAVGSTQINNAQVQSRVEGKCDPGSSIRTIDANGTTVTCEIDDVGTGTVTQVNTGTGLTGGPITTTGAISLASNYSDGSVYDTRFVNITGDTMTGALNLPSNGLAVGTNQLVVSGGNVGIGTANPRATLDVSGYSSFFGTCDGDLLVTKGYGVIKFKDDPLGGCGDTAYLSYHASGGNGNESTVLEIGNQNDQDDHIALMPSGNVGIGTTTPGEKLDVNGIAKVVKLIITSDLNLKKNINTIKDALNKIERLRGVEFEWRREEFSDRSFPEGTQIGLIAQEVENVLPELVSVNNYNGQKSVEYANIVAVLIEAVKDLKTQNDGLRARIEALENK
ncbi:MAG TPA: hypothetical protein DDX84_10545, partial [Nitrospiraceae bacterium]|nr:hypothetical protein [Nitrospiraceae bacterium]